MKRYPKPLTKAFIEKKNLFPGKYYDQHGLYLRVRQGRARYWVQKVVINGKSREIKVGPYPVVTLDEARRIVHASKALIAAGEHPLQHRGRREAKRKEPTVAEFVKVVFKKRGYEDSPRRSAKDWLRTLELHVTPYIGRLLVSQVETADVYDVLMKIWHDKPVMARKARWCLHTVMAHAIAEQYRRDNPAGELLLSILPPNNREVKHNPAIHHSDVACALARVRESRAMISTKLSFAFMVYTAARLGEVRFATWDEIDLKARVWSIPGERMKTGHDHRVPLSSQALEIVHEARKLDNDSGIMFPSGWRRPISNGAHSRLLRRLDLPCVPHGFRSTFRDWCGESSIPRLVAEACLAHGKPNPYRDTDLFDARVNVMERWGAHIEVRAAAVKVDVSFRFDEI